MTTRHWVFGVVFVGASGFFVGGFGLVLAVLVAVLWVAVNPPRWMYWAGSVALMALAPVAIVAQGLPASPVVGPGFGASHLVAHWLVAGALMLAAFASILEILEVGVSKSDADPVAETGQVSASRAGMGSEGSGETRGRAVFRRRRTQSDTDPEP